MCLGLFAIMRPEALTTAMDKLANPWKRGVASLQNAHSRALSWVELEFSVQLCSFISPASHSADS
jgi:hypothetical protein